MGVCPEAGVSPLWSMAALLSLRLEVIASLLRLDGVFFRSKWSFSFSVFWLFFFFVLNLILNNNYNYNRFIDSHAARS